jgi:hypothetical protein
MTSSDNEGFIPTYPLDYTKLHEAGYAIGGYVDDGKDRWVLYRVDKGNLDKVHDFESLEALQLMAKLLIDGGV